MAEMYAAFEIESQNGAIVVRDSESDGDVSDWDPNDGLSYVDRNAAIFAITPGVDGPVRCEVWRGAPEEQLQHVILRETFSISGALSVEDPAGLINVHVASIRGEREIVVLADQLSWLERVGIVVDPNA